MSTEIMQKYLSDGIRELERMEQASLRGKTVCLETLMRIIRENENTAYGRKYHFRDIHSYEDYVRFVPLSDYGDYESYINRMVAFGEKNLITARDVVYYAHTSGSSGSPKMIPRTQEELDLLFSTIFSRVFAMYGPEYRGINLMESRIGFTPKGVMHGAISETLNRPEDTADCYVLPEEIVYPAAEFDRRHIKLLFALREKHLGFLMATFSPAVYDLLVYLCQHWRELCEDIESGSIRPDVMVDRNLRKKLEARLPPDPARAQEIREIMTLHENGAFIPLLWPDLKVVATVGTATFAPYVARIRQALGPGIPVDHLGYVSSEATVAAEIRPEEPAYLLLPYTGFYEFIPADGSDAHPLRMDQLEIGKEYELILTNLSGFYRYRIDDVIRVTGFHHECPMIVFSYRKNQLVNMYGEKMADSVIRHSVNALAEETGTDILEYSIYPDTEADPGRYVILLESDREIRPEHWSYYSEVLNRKLCEAHDSYRDKMTRKIMQPLLAKFVQPQTYALYRDLKTMEGASPNQIKPVHVITGEKLKRFFFGLLQD